MIEPSPNCLVMEESASSMFLSRSALTAGDSARPRLEADDFDSTGTALDMVAIG